MDEIREVTVRLISSFTVINVLFSNLHTSGMLNVLCYSPVWILIHTRIRHCVLFCTVIILYACASKATEKKVSFGWIRGSGTKGKQFVLMSYKCAIFNNHFCSTIDFRISSYYSAVWALRNSMKLFQKMIHLYFRHESKKKNHLSLASWKHRTHQITARSLLFKGPVSKMPCYLLPNTT